MDRRPSILRWLPAPLRRGIRNAASGVLRWVTRHETMAGAHLSAKTLPIEPDLDAFVLGPADINPPRAADGFAIPPKELWWEYAQDAQTFLDAGTHHVRTMLAALERNGYSLQPDHSVLELGCASGPMLRHFAPHAQAGLATRGGPFRGSAWGVDISQPHIAWCLAHLSPPLRFASVTTAPHLPFPDASFNLLYAGSVFSHLGELTEAWLCEIARVLRPGGRAYLTYIPRESLDRYLQEWPAVQFSREVAAKTTAEQRAGQYRRLVVGREPWQHAVFDPAHFHQLCAQVLDVLEDVPNAYSFQSAVVLGR